MQSGNTTTPLESILTSTMLAFPSQFSLLLLLFLYATTFHISMSSISNQRVVRCNDKDEGALLLFKQGLIDPSNRLSTWSSGHDCCAWKGVHCHNTTGRVTSLDLNSLEYFDNKSELFKGEINLSLLLQLEFLNYLDLSWNNITSLSIRDNITTATSLHHLDLSYNLDLHIDNLHWLSQLSSLKYLDLSEIDLHKQTNWLHMVAMLPSLSGLTLFGCGLTRMYSSLKFVNFTSLETLDLSYNNFNSELPYWLFNLSSGISDISIWESRLHGEIPSSMLNLRNLKSLDLRWNQLNGSIPNWLGQLEHLESIDLSHNLFSGYIPSSLGNLSSLTDLDISSNLLTGNLLDILEQLSNLSTLRVGNNSLSGVLSEGNFSKFSNLKDLDLSSSDFEFDMDTNWIPSFQLYSIDLSNTVQGPNFPAWLYTQRSLKFLDLSNTGITSLDGDKFPSFVAGIYSLYLNNNSISADISNVMLSASTVRLEYNNFTGRLPHISSNAVAVDVSHNSFSGGFPNSWVNCTELFHIDVSSNNLAGELPLNMSNLTELQSINLENNAFSGKIPIRMPPNSRTILLRSNQFVGNIPPQLCYLTALHILDLSHNKLSGSIPRCLHKIANMVSGENASRYNLGQNTFNLINKGIELEYSYSGLVRSKGLLRFIDLSVNNLSGEIPSELFRLVKVQSLNLSHNHLSGTIPNMIGDMLNLESLDLSYNQLAGEIPQSLSALTFLEFFNISYNNFHGQIPLGSQLQTFDAWSYVGNPELCGAPLTKNCTKEENLCKAKGHAGGDPFKESLYLGIGVGFAVGFWGVCGSLFFNRTWRHAYFQFLTHVADRIYVIVALKFFR